VHSGGREVFGGAPGEHVDVLPIQRAVALIGFGLPDPRALLGGVLGAEGQHRGQRLLVAEQRDRPQPEVAGVHHPQLRHMQRAVRFDPLDQHGQFIHVRHDPCRTASGDRARPVPVVARLSIGSADEADQVAGVVGPHVVDQGLQLAGTHRAHRVLLTTRSVRPQQFLQEAFGRIKVALPHRFP